MKVGFLLATVLFAIFAATPGSAQNADGIAGALPANVTEVTTGGSWTKGEQNGSFRAIVVMTGDKEPEAAVFVQLLAFEKNNPVAKVVKTLSVKEVRERKLQNAFVNFDSENENRATLIITSYDAEKDEDNSLYVEVSADGAYKIIEAPKDDGETPAKSE